MPSSLDSAIGSLSLRNSDNSFSRPEIAILRCSVGGRAVSSVEVEFRIFCSRRWRENDAANFVPRKLFCAATISFFAEYPEFPLTKETSPRQLILTKDIFWSDIQ